MAIGSLSVNYLAVFIAGLINFFVGAIWYSPVVFGKAWAKLSGITRRKANKARKKGLFSSYLLVFIGSMAIAYILANFILYLNATSFLAGSEISLIAWMGFVVPILLKDITWEGKPVKLYCMHIFYYLISFILMGGLLAVWH